MKDLIAAMRITKLHAFFIAVLVFASLWVADRHHWFRQAPVRAQGPNPAAECHNLRRHGDPGARACYQRLAQSRDLVLRGEGLWGLKDYYGANEAFKAAANANKNDVNVRVRWGRMFLEHYGPADAQALFQEALKISESDAEALLGMALVASQSFEGAAIEFAKKALEVDPTLAEAQALIARIHLEDNNPEKAREAAKQALQISKESLEALTVLAVADWLEDKPGTEWLDQVNQINPRYAKLYEEAGHFFVINRRYDEGINYYRKAIELEPDLWSAHTELGVNLMRFAKEEEARHHLELAYNNGWKAEIVVNTLRLMDSYKNFETHTTPATILRVHKKEAALVRPYFQAEFERALATYEKKYKYKLDGPVQVEVYPDHADFEVRTMGLPGLGALGVTFGKVVAMDSPSSRRPGDFHWASTLWHELSHVFVLSMTNSRTPRWFTEGVAVYEETATEPHWGDRLTPNEIEAIKEKKLLPIAELDRGFIHPSYPAQVVVSYYQGGQVITFIVEKWGYDAVLQMIHAFAQRKSTEQVIREVLKLTPEQFDQQFFPWLEARTRKTVEGFEDWRKRLLKIAEDAKNKDWDPVIREGTAIRDIYPDYVEPGSVYEFLAQAYLARQEKAKAIAELEKYASVGGRNPATLKQLAELQAEAGDKRGAAATLEKLNVIYLQDDKAHQMLGKLYMELGNPRAAVREYTAMLASGALDVAGGRLALAQAYRAAGDKEAALDQVYLALEAAPGYRDAQKLLLELSAQ